MKRRFPSVALLCSTHKLTHSFSSLFKPSIPIPLPAPLGTDLASDWAEKVDAQRGFLLHLYLCQALSFSFWPHKEKYFFSGGGTLALAGSQFSFPRVYIFCSLHLTNTTYSSHFGRILWSPLAFSSHSLGNFPIFKCPNPMLQHFRAQSVRPVEGRAGVGIGSCQLSISLIQQCGPAPNFYQMCPRNLGTWGEIEFSELSQQWPLKKKKSTVRSKENLFLDFNPWTSAGGLRFRSLFFVSLLQK